MVVAGTSVVLLVFLMNTTKTGLVPDEDQGTLFVNVSTAPGSSLKTTNDIIDRVEKRLEDLPQKLHLQKLPVTVCCPGREILSV